jgi:hypothetical protein
VGGVCVQRGQSVLWSGEPVGEFPSVTLEAKLAEELKLGLVVFNTGEETLDSAANRYIESVLAETHENFIERGNWRVSTGIGQGGEVREVPGLTAGSRTRLRQSKDLPPVFTEPRKGGRSGE